MKGRRVLEIPKLPVIRATTAKVPTELWRDVANNEYAKQEKSSKCQWINLLTSKILIWTTIHLNSDSTGQIPVIYRHFNSKINFDLSLSERNWTLVTSRSYNCSSNSSDLKNLLTSVWIGIMPTSSGEVILYFIQLYQMKIKKSNYLSEFK